MSQPLPLKAEAFHQSRRRFAGFFLATVAVFSGIPLTATVFDFERIAAAPVGPIPFGAVARQPIPFGEGRLMFSVRGNGIWTTDGTATGTAPLAECFTECPVDAHFLAHSADLAYFSAQGPDGSRGLWVTDFTPQGTLRVADLALPEVLRQEPTILIDGLPGDPGHFFFVAETDGAGREVWVSGGSPETTRLATDLRPGSDSSFPDLVLAQGNRVLMVADDGIHGREVWSLDASTTEARLMADLQPGAGSSFPHGFAPLGEAVVFFARTPSGLSLLRLEADGAEPVVLRDWPAGRDAVVRFSQAVPGGLVYFALAAEPAQIVLDTTLWVTDGTSAGTFAVTDALPGDIDPLDRRGIAPRADATLFRVSYFSPAGAPVELWISDGTAANTFRLLATQMVNPSSAFGDLHTFRQFDTETGSELWTTDGTPAGTVRVFDLCPGPCSGDPHGSVRLGERIVFLGWDESGRRLWSWDGEGEPRLVADLPIGTRNNLSGLWPLGERALIFLETDRLEVWSVEVRPPRLKPRRLRSLP